MQPSIKQIISQKKNPSNFLIELAGSPASAGHNEREESLFCNIPLFQRYEQIPMIITDHGSMEYLFVDKNVDKLIGYAHCDVYKEGITLVHSLIHPDDAERVLTSNHDLFNVYFSLPLAERLGYTYCHEFRVKKPDGRYIWMLHEITFLNADGEGRPLLSSSVGKDITALKTDNTMNLWVGRYEDGINYKMAFSKKYPLHLPSIKLSRKEVEILKMIGDGLLSKQIAEKLHISFHTVNTHRRNMLEKTNTSTSGGLVSYAQEHGFI